MTSQGYPFTLPLDPAEVEALDSLLLAAVGTRSLPPVLVPVVLRVHALAATSDQ